MPFIFCLTGQAGGLVFQTPKLRLPIPEFYEILDEYDKRFEYAKKHTALPELPDYKRIEEFQADVNERVVKGEV